MQALAHYRRWFAIRRSGPALGVLALWTFYLSMLFAPRHGGHFPWWWPASGLLMATGWFWRELLIAWSLLTRRPALSVQKGELVLVHPWMVRIPLSEVRRVELTLAGPHGWMVIESEKRSIKLPQDWAREELETVAAAVRRATGSPDWIAAAPVVHPAAPTPVG